MTIFCKQSHFTRANLGILSIVPLFTLKTDPIWNINNMVLLPYLMGSRNLILANPKATVFYPAWWEDRSSSHGTRHSDRKVSNPGISEPLTTVHILAEVRGNGVLQCCLLQRPFLWVLGKGLVLFCLCFGLFFCLNILYVTKKIASSLCCGAEISVRDQEQKITTFIFNTI